MFVRWTQVKTWEDFQKLATLEEAVSAMRRRDMRIAYTLTRELVSLAEDRLLLIHRGKWPTEMEEKYVKVTDSLKERLAKL